MMDRVAFHGVPVKKTEVLVCLAGFLICIALQIFLNRVDTPDMFDSRQYVGAAYNLAHHGVFQEKPSLEMPEPGLGREPAYGFLLAGLFTIDPLLSGITPDCLLSAAGCRAAFYRSAVGLNFILVALTGLLTYLTARLITKSRVAATIAGFHIWLNVFVYSSMGQLVSDPLAMMLSALFVLFATHYLIAGRLVWSLAAGGVLGLLTLTKAVVLYFFLSISPVLLIVALIAIVRSRSFRPMGILAAFAIVYLALTGPWMDRNAAISGNYVVATGRAGIALGVREYYNQMTLAEYGTAFVYWTRVVGAPLAKQHIAERHWTRFDENNENSFFLVGHARFPQTSARIASTTNVGPSVASDMAIREIIVDIAHAWPVHLATTVALFWRGAMVDLFLPFSLPAFMFISILAFRRRNQVWAGLLSIGWFSLLFYPLISLNVPRYQMLSAPSLSVGLALAAYSIFISKSNNGDNFGRIKRVSVE